MKKNNTNRNYNSNLQHNPNLQGHKVPMQNINPNMQNFNPPMQKNKQDIRNYYQDLDSEEYDSTKQLDVEEDNNKEITQGNKFVRNKKTILAFCLGIAVGVFIMSAKEALLESGIGSPSVDDSIISEDVEVENIGESNIEEAGGSVKASTIGIGGGDAMFSPLISPHNNEHMLVLSEKGGLYLSYDKAKSWTKKYLNGMTLCAEYDPSKKDVLYVGGNGLYRSVDNGKSFETSNWLMYEADGKAINGIGWRKAGKNRNLSLSAGPAIPEKADRRGASKLPLQQL